jgi:hypothetical protein
MPSYDYDDVPISSPYIPTPSLNRPNYTEYDVDNTYLRERDSYFEDIFQKRGDYDNVSF